MSSVLENLIATIFSTMLSTTVGFVLQTLGLGTKLSVASGTILFAFALIFLVARKYYPKFRRKLTERFLDQALDLGENEADKEKLAFKAKIVDRVLLENVGVQLEESSSVVEFNNQAACEPHIREAARNAKKVKVLTIRGEKYFLGPNSFLYPLYTSKRPKDATIEVLVLSPDSKHISDDLATNLDHESAEEIRNKMRIVVDYLMHLASLIRNFEVKCYDESPNFKILLFDDVMFVSSFAQGGPKNDHHTKMLQIKRDGNPLFTGFEQLFDDLSKRSDSLSKEVVGRA